MQKDSRLAFEHSFYSDSTYSYLVLRLHHDTRILNHQAEIICQNPNSAFVPFHIRCEDENTGIYYNITSKISLSQYLERKRLSRNELLDLLKDITKNLMLHSNYLLDLSSFVIDLDFIYINPATAEVSMIYIPACFDRNMKEFYIAFLKDLVVNLANIDDSAGDNYLHRILNYLKSDAFSLYDFIRLIVDLRNSEGIYTSTTKSIHEHMDDAINTSVPERRCYKNESPENTVKRKNAPSIVFPHLIIIIAAAIACLLMMSRGKGDTVSIAGVMIIAAALDILAVKRISGKGNKKATTEDRGPQAIDKHNHISQNKTGKRVDLQDMPKKQELRPDKSRYQEVSPAPDVLKGFDTIMISEVPKACHPYLESIGTQSVEKVIINKDKFIIGRLSSMVDYIMQGSTVGKLHAEITINQGLYYIKDLNSKNGTYINDMRIPSNKEFEIKKNDKVRFSDFEYVFRYQEIL